MFPLKKALKRSSAMRLAYGGLLAVLTKLSPKWSTLVRFRISKGRALDFNRPSTFDERISWLKVQIYTKSELVRQCADKFRVRQYVESRGLEYILNDLYGVYDSPSDIAWEGLPEAFALKWSGGSGGVLICHDKSSLDIDRAVEQLARAGRKRSHSYSAELQYLGSPNRLLCERLIESEAGSFPVDYKFYCYEGVPKFVLVCVGRGEGLPQLFFYDMGWTRIHGLRRDGREAEVGVEWAQPDGFEEAVEVASVLSAPFPFVRVDLYLEGGKPVLGELTFTPAGGVNSGLSERGDAVLGAPLSWLFESVGE